MGDIAWLSLHTAGCPSYGHFLGSIGEIILGTQKRTVAFTTYLPSKLGAFMRALAWELPTQQPLHSEPPIPVGCSQIMGYF